MATIGGSLYAEPVHVFFDGLRSYNAEAACAVLADDADLVSPWNEGTLTGKDDIQAVLESLVSNPETRPSFTIQDVRGDGNIVQLDVSMSGRFGRAPQNVRIACLHLHGRIHHVVIEGRGAPIKWAPVKVAKPEPTPVVEEAPAVVVASEGTYLDYAGDNDDIIDIEGIGPTYAKRLYDAGIRTTARLCYESTERIGEVSKAKPGTVAAWKAMAELMKISGVGGQYAEALYRGGVTGIADFQGKSAASVAKAINAYFDGVETTVQKNKITDKRVGGWLKAAKAMAPVEQPIPVE